MSEALKLIQQLNKQDRDYLETYFAGAPFWLMEAFQIIRFPGNKTFITEGDPAVEIYILLKGSVVAEEHRVKDMTYGFIRFIPIEVFGVMELMFEMNEYQTTLVTAADCLFLKTSRDAFRKWFEHDFCAYRMECKKVGHYLLEQARKERLYVLLQGVERIYLVLYKMYQTYARGGSFVYEQEGLYGDGRYLGAYRDPHLKGPGGKRLHYKRGLEDPHFRKAVRDDPGAVGGQIVCF